LQPTSAPIRRLAKRPCAQIVYRHPFLQPCRQNGAGGITRGKEQGDIAVVIDFVRQIRKTPIVVNDERFFLRQPLHPALRQRRRAHAAKVSLR
jgi:3-hydroxyacyl-CoA dehydrogenase/enoyl-CoA hydratase/3-hydroxybutyryl-CoA epimerase